MNVVYNAYVLNKPITGVGRYLQALSFVSSKYNKVALTPNSNYCWDNKFNSIRSWDAKTKLMKLFWNYFHPLFYNINFDVYHSPYPSLPFFLPNNCKKIITVHDLIFISSPENYPYIELIFLKLSLRYAVHKADVIICVSNYTKTSLLKLYPEYASKVVVVLNSAYITSKIDDLDICNETLKMLLHNDIKYFVLPSNRHPRKNIKNTIKAFLLSDFHQNNYKLVLSGIDESMYSINDNNIIDISYLNDNDYTKLLKKSKGILYFSYDEGFGYPITEAIENEIPIYCSNIPSSLELFDNNNYFLCNDLTIDGIKEFLNDYYNNPSRTEKLLTYLRSLKSKFEFKNFEATMSFIYS